MDLLILQKEPDDAVSKYRGTYRSGPSFIEGVGENHPTNQYFLWFLKEGGQSGVVHDLGQARKLVEAYARLSPPQYFEILEITRRDHLPQTDSESLGFDLSNGYLSLLSWGLEVDRKTTMQLPANDLSLVLQPLLKLVKSYFKPLLNKSGLFSDFEIASFCLDCMLTLQEIRPGLWENESVNFEVLGVWRVPMD